MQRSRGILFDLDGVVYNAETLIEGAAEVIAWVRREKIPFLFVTNTTSHPRETLVRKLESFGITAVAEELWTPAVAANLWLSERRVSPAALFVPPETATEFVDVAVSDEGAKAVQDAVQWRTPSLLLYAGQDRLVNPQGSVDFAAAASPQFLQTQCFNVMYHEIFNEVEAGRVFDDMRAWMSGLRAAECVGTRS